MNTVFIIVIIGLVLICAGLLVIITRYRFKDSDAQRRIKEWDDTDMIYWKDELK